MAYLGEDSGVLVSGSVGHRVIAHACGPRWDEVLDDLMADPAVGALSVRVQGGLDPLHGPPRPGFRLITRWEHRFDLRFAPASVGSPPAGYEVFTYDPERREQVAELLAATNRGPDGLFLAYPELPTREVCLTIVEGLEAGRAGAFVPEVSFQAFSGGQLVGVTLAVRQPPADVLLFEIAVRLRHRGSGLAVYLLDRLKHELARQRLDAVRFATLDSNPGANALFHESQGASTPGDSVWIWLRT